MCTPENIKSFISKRLSRELLLLYRGRECTPDRLTVAVSSEAMQSSSKISKVGVNVDFQELCKWTARSFAEQGGSGGAAGAGAVSGLSRCIELFLSARIHEMSLRKALESDRKWKASRRRSTLGESSVLHGRTRCAI